VPDAEPLAVGDPADPVQAEVASAASTTMVLPSVAPSLARIRMKPPDCPGLSPPVHRLFPVLALTNRHSRKNGVASVTAAGPGRAQHRKSAPAK
jgi:hypothetical protein